MRNSLILFLVYFRISEQLTVGNIICQCSTILTAFDCNQLSSCEWDLQQKICIEVKNLSVAYSSILCSSITNGLKCAQQRGCAFINKKCVIFSNCQSYIATSNVECQKYSLLCNWSIQNNYCTDQSVCNEYYGEDKQTGCESVKQINGESMCIYNTQTKQCKEKECKDYPKKKNEECSKVLLNQVCITDKKTCLKELQNCETYNIEDCLNILAKNGECEINDNTNKCQLRTCQMAPDASSDDTCKKYKSTCLSNKQKCFEQLPPCSSYSLDECLNLKGNKGDCQLNSDNSICKDPACEDFKGSTDEECKKASPNLQCITNGFQCVSVLADTCNKVKILEGSTCDQYISLEGQCKAQAQGLKTCILDSCQNYEYNSDEQCNKYSSKGSSFQNLCISNGVKCTTQLLSCSSYQKSDGCFKYKGQDGKCIENESSNICQVIPCEQIQQPSLTTCITSNPNCSFDGQDCVISLKLCNQYTSKCDTIISINNKPCIEDPNNSEKCTEKTCNMAPSTMKTDEDCDKYLSKCLTNGQGCTDKLSKCDSYTGTFQLCEKLIGLDGKCTGISKTQTNEQCKAKVCQESSTANEQACQAYTKNCLYNGIMKKCQPSIESCQIIDNQINCEQTLTSASGRFCMWVNQSCVSATCNMIEQFGSQEVCQIFGDNCEYDSFSGCKDKTYYLCQQLRSRALCTTDSSGNACIWDFGQKKCLKFNKCDDFQLVRKQDLEGNTVLKNDNEIAQDNLICSSISDKCLADGSETCKHKLPCQQFNKESCQYQFGIDDKKCGYNSIKQICQTFRSCADLELKTHAECQAYNNKCTTNKETCIDNIECQMIKEQSLCEAGGIDGRCFWNNSTCSIWKCENAIHSTHQECQKESINCTTNGNSCIDLQDCSKYIKEGCQIGINKTICFFDDNKNLCRIKVCSDYTEIIDQNQCLVLGCAFDSIKQACFNFDNCNNYLNQNQCNENLSKDNSICIWQESINATSTCQQMISCSQANSFEKNCKNFGCLYQPQGIINSTISSSQCVQMDCSSFNSNSNAVLGCKPVINTITNRITLCSWNSVENKCTETTGLSVYNQNNCFILTQYNYYWNPTTSQCVQCTKTDKPSNQTKSNNTPNTTTEVTQNSFGIVLSTFKILLAILCLQLI